MLSDRDYTRHTHGGGRGLRPEGSIVTALIIVNIIVYLLQIFTEMRLTQFIILNAYHLKRFELWRLGTYMFAHGSFTHILFNMWGLYIFGKPLEERLGGHKFLHMYLLSGLIGGLTWLGFNWHPEIPPHFFPGVIGASGSVFGVLAASAIMFPNRIYVLLFPPIPMRLKTLAAVFAVIEVISLLSQSGGRIAHLAHLGGMLGGYIYMRWFFGGNWGGHGLGISPAAWWRQLRGWIRRRQFRHVASGSNRESGTGNAGVAAEEIDRILDKIGAQGISSLTRQERQVLQEARDQLKKRH